MTDGPVARPPLAGLRVLDLSRVIAGPYLAMMLADLGAEVIKVEAPGVGDDGRHMRPAGLEGDSPLFVHLNRNKQSVEIDIASEAGRELIRRLADVSDVLLENFRPDVMGRHGLDYASLAARNPRLVYCSISGYGQTGPFRMVAGYDPVAQAEAGLMYLTGPAEIEPQKAGGSVADTFAGLHAGMAVLAALHARQASGRGQHVEVALFESMLAAIGYAHQHVQLTGENPPRPGNGSYVVVPLGVFPCADGPIMLVAANEAQWRRLCRDVIERPDLLEDLRLDSIPKRAQHRAEVEAIVREALARDTRANWIARMRKAGVPAGEVRSMSEALASPEAAARGMVQRVEHPFYGAIETVGSPLRLSATPVRPAGPAPLLGQHTDAVLAEVLGLDGDEIARLRAAGALGRERGA